MITPAVAKKKTNQTKKEKRKRKQRDENIGGNLHHKYFNHYSMRGEPVLITGPLFMRGKEIELKDRISDVTEMIPRRLLRATLGRGVLKIWVCFLET